MADDLHGNEGQQSPSAAAEAATAKITTPAATLTAPTEPSVALGELSIKVDKHDEESMAVEDIGYLTSFFVCLGGIFCPTNDTHPALVLSFYANCGLTALKLFVAVFSGSMSVIASTIDSCLDVVCASIMMLTCK